jgi:hypothetical protein
MIEIRIGTQLGWMIIHPPGDGKIGPASIREFLVDAIRNGLYS